MKSKSRTIVALAAVALLAFPAAASSAIDYSKNAANGEYTVADAPSVQHSSKDYSKNAANGEYAPADSRSVEVVAAIDDGGFAWGDAAIGAGVALAVIALGATVFRRRRIASPAT